MNEFIKQIIAAGEVPVSLKRTPTVFGNEVEFRWRRYHNSRIECVKVEYNMSEEKFAQCGREIAFLL